MTLRDPSGSALALTRGSDFPKCQLGPKYMWSRLEQRTRLSLMEWSRSHALVQTKEFRPARAATCSLIFLCILKCSKLTAMYEAIPSSIFRLVHLHDSKLYVTFNWRNEQPSCLHSQTISSYLDSSNKHQVHVTSKQPATTPSPSYCNHPQSRK